MAKKSKKIICTNYANGKCHDFRVYKESGVQLNENTRGLTDTGYLGLQKIHTNTSMPKKKSKKTSQTNVKHFIHSQYNC